MMSRQAAGRTVAQQPSDRGRFGDFRRGDTVTVRSLTEILATLDADAKLGGLPFMPEMAACCGRSFRVYRRADKTCVEGLGMRSMRDTVFLDGLRCDGSAHGGCQRGCLFFWKEAWLSRNKAGAGRRKGERATRRPYPPRRATASTANRPSWPRPPGISLPARFGISFTISARASWACVALLTSFGWHC